jgi:prepilin signal peptidase PulO-like enzyme (type II secretory pathway)
MLWLTVRVAPAEAASPERPANVPSDTGTRGTAAPDGAQPQGPASGATIVERRTPFAAGAIATAALCALALALLAVVPNASVPFAAVNLPLHTAFLAMFFAIVLASGHHRPADQEIHIAVEQEASTARWVVLGESVWLLPIVAAAAGAAALIGYVPAAAGTWSSAVQWSVGPFHPVAGAAFAMQGAMVGAAAGWIVRILFTIVFGREAFATGDIFILAAAGAVMGWDLVLLGFLLSIPLALAGWLLSLILKRSLMIAFGPWLAIGFMAALWLNRPSAELAQELGERFRFVWEEQPQTLLLFGTVLAAGSVFAVVLARMVRGFVQPTYEESPRPGGPSNAEQRDDSAGDGAAPAAEIRPAPSSQPDTQ